MKVLGFVFRITGTSLGIIGLIFGIYRPKKGENLKKELNNKRIL